MRSVFWLVCFALGGVGASLCMSETAHASVDYHRCLYETGTDFGERIDFGYDLERNSILVRQHRAGAGYTPDFTLGNVSRDGGKLLFEFEFWESGTVAMRERLSLDFETMILDAAHYFYNEDGSSAGDGQTALAACRKEADGTNSQSATVAEVVTSPVEHPPASSGQRTTAVPDPVCHTREFGAEGPKSATYCVISQLPSQNGTSYGPENLAQADGAWCEGDEGQGIGAGVELSFQPYGNDAPPLEYDRLLISNGYDKSTRAFMENSRVKKIEIKSDDEYGGQTWVRTLRDETGVQEVLLGGKVRPYGILITILDVYPGQKYEDTCLSFVNADFGF